jgi:hypothetical protein
MPIATASGTTRASCVVLDRVGPVSSQPTLNAASTASSATRVAVTAGGQTQVPSGRRAATGAPSITPAE